ncbi:MAG TPA: hypothetical protein VFQ38_14930 [Longimicrobiales bacterium]|nr:hypothetical protein [Longimicrobiales bacterium]
MRPQVYRVELSEALPLGDVGTDLGQLDHMMAPTDAHLCVSA